MDDWTYPYPNLDVDAPKQPMLLDEVRGRSRTASALPGRSARQTASPSSNKPKRGKPSTAGRSTPTFRFRSRRRPVPR